MSARRLGTEGRQNGHAPHVIPFRSKARLNAGRCPSRSVSANTPSQSKRSAQSAAFMLTSRLLLLPLAARLVVVRGLERCWRKALAIRVGPSSRPSGSRTSSAGRFMFWLAVFGRVCVTGRVSKHHVQTRAGDRRDRASDNLVRCC